MSVIIRVPTQLRKLCAGAETIEADGATVGVVLQSLRTSHPDLAAQVLKEDGGLRAFVNVFANDEDIRFLDDLDTEVDDGDELSLVPAIAGG